MPVARKHSIPRKPHNRSPGFPRTWITRAAAKTWVTSERWGPFDGELLHMSYGRSALYLVMKEKQGELMQGGVVQFPVRFTSSAMRARFNERDGQLYVSGTARFGKPTRQKNGGLDRVRYTGKPVYMPSGLKVKPGGIEISFTQKLDPESAADPDNYAIDAADIKWSQNYGSKEYEWGQRDLDQNKWKQGWAEMYVDDAKLLPDGKTVFLEMADLEPVHLMHINFNIQAADGTPIKSENLEYDPRGGVADHEHHSPRIDRRGWGGAGRQRNRQCIRGLRSTAWTNSSAFRSCRAAEDDRRAAA